MIFIDNHVAVFERCRLLPEDDEPERAIQCLRGGLPISDGKENLLQAVQGLRAF